MLKLPHNSFNKLVVTGGSLLSWIGGFLKTSFLKLNLKSVQVILRTLTVTILLSIGIQHGLDHAWSLHGILVLFHYGDFLTLRILRQNGEIHVEAKNKAQVGIVHAEDVEFECACLSKPLLHLKDGLILLSSDDLLNLHDSLLCLLVHNHDVPLVLLEEGILLRDNPARVLVLLQVVVLEHDSDGYHILSRHVLLSVAKDLVSAGHQGHGLYHVLNLLQLGFVSIEKSNLGSLLWSEFAEGLDAAISDLVLLQ